MASKETPQSIGRYKSELEKSKKRRIDCAAEYPEEWNQLPLTRKHAESFDSKPVHYFNAKRCPKNHLERKFISNGKCVKCCSNENLHFDHILPFSKGGSSKVASNIQLLCAKHNLQKGARFI